MAALTAETYLEEGHATASYEPFLRAVEARAREATVLVALDDGRVVGAVTVATRGGPWAEQAGPGDAVIRMLVTDPEARGQGVGTSLVRACLDLARSEGCTRVKLSTQRHMDAAHRLYERFGFRRTPESDWSPEPGVDLVTYALDLAA